MASWQLALDLEAGGEQPIFIRLARAISDDVRRGRLKPGDSLPGSRSLARALGVHRNTVLAAYAELTAEGWITTEAAARTFVSHALPDVENAPPRRAGASAPGFELPARPHSREPRRDLLPLPEVLAMSGGIPDVRLVPVAALARAYRRALQRGGPTLLGYGDARGHARLRRALADMLAALRGVPADGESLMVTRGSQLALDLVARTLLRPGDIVAVEALGYRPAWSALAAAGARLVPVAVDEHGLDVEALEALAARERLRAVYVTPHHQYPTTVMLDAGRRLRLLELARARRIAVIEDDYDFEFHYEGRPVLPLAAADRHAVVVYVGTLSKILAPSLRLGFVVAPPLLIERLSEQRFTHHRARAAMAAYDAAPCRPDAALSARTQCGRTARPARARRRRQRRYLDVRLAHVERGGKAALGKLMQAMVGDDVGAAVALLADDARSLGDGGGRYRAATRPLVGAVKVARFFHALARRHTVRTLEIRMINGLPAIVTQMDPPAPDWAPRGVLRVDVGDDERVVAVHSILAPDKLRALRF